MQESRIEEAIYKFLQEYGRKRPYGEYINGVGRTSRAVVEWRKGSKKSSLEKIVKDLKKKKIDPNAPCLKVNLRKPLPKKIRLPKRYNGFLVFAEVVGSIQAF